MTTSDDNAFFSERTLCRERLCELICMINDKSLPWAERDCAKNELLLAQADFIWSKVHQRTGGRVGIADRQTELYDSAFAYLKERASNIAEAVEDHGVSLLSAVSKRLEGWAVGKIRRKQTLFRGGGNKNKPASALDAAEVHTLPPDEEAIYVEWLAQIKAAVFSAVVALDDVEQVVILSYFGFGGPEMTMREVADSRGIPLSEAHKARRRAKYKLRQWLKDYDPANSNQ